MEYVEVQKIMNRMCSSMAVCRTCKLSSVNNGASEVCSLYATQHPEEAQKVAIEWDREHPVRTRQSAFLTYFLDVPMAKEGYIDLCPMHVNIKFFCPEGLGCQDCKKEYWLEELKEEKK